MSGGAVVKLLGNYRRQIGKGNYDNYSAVREGCETGLPIVRALWLHYPDDPAATALGDQYLWSRDVMVSPVMEKGATTRRLYLPRGRSRSGSPEKRNCGRWPSPDVL